MHFIGGKKKDPELGTNFFLGIEYNCHGMCTFLWVICNTQFVCCVRTVTVVVVSVLSTNIHIHTYIHIYILTQYFTNLVALFVLQKNLLDKTFFFFGFLEYLQQILQFLEHMKVTQVCKSGHMNFYFILSAFVWVPHLLAYLQVQYSGIVNNLAFCFCACLQLPGSELCKSQKPWEEKEMWRMMSLSMCTI